MCSSTPSSEAAFAACLCNSSSGVGRLLASCVSGDVKSRLERLLSVTAGQLDKLAPATGRGRHGSVRKALRGTLAATRHQWLRQRGASATVLCRPEDLGFFLYWDWNPGTQEPGSCALSCKSRLCPCHCRCRCPCGFPRQGLGKSVKSVRCSGWPGLMLMIVLPQPPRVTGITGVRHHARQRPNFSRHGWRPGWKALVSAWVLGFFRLHQQGQLVNASKMQSPACPGLLLTTL